MYVFKIKNYIKSLFIAIFFNINSCSNERYEVMIVYKTAVYLFLSIGKGMCESSCGLLYVLKLPIDIILNPNLI